MHGEADIGQRLGQPWQPFVVMRTATVHMCDIIYGGQSGSLCGGADIERAAHPIQDTGDVGWAIRPPQSQGGQSKNFGKRTQHYHIAARFDHLCARRIIVAGNIFRISGINHEQDIVAQTVAQSLQFIAGNITASWIVRVGDKRHARLVCNCG